MTVTVQTPENEYTANGIVDTFAYAFYVLDANDLFVYLDDVLQVAGYTVTNIGDPAGGDVVFDTPPAAAVIVRLTRSVPLDRQIDYVAGGGISSTTLDNDIDRTVLMMQDLDHRLSAAIEASGIDDPGTNGILVRISAGTATTREVVGPAAGITVTNGTGVGGNPTLALANDLSALEGLASTGIAVRSAADTWVQRTVTGTADQVTVTNGSGVSGNPTLTIADNPILPGTGSVTAPIGTTAQRPGSPVDGMARYNSTLGQFEFRENGSWVQFGSGSGSVTSVAATAPAAGFTIAGSPITTSGTLTFTLADDLAALEGLAATGLAARTAANTWAQRTITAGTSINVADGDGVAGNPTISVTGLVIGTNVQAWDAGLDAIAALAVTDGNIIVGDGATWVVESGATARTSLGLGTGNSPEFTGIELGHASDTTITRSGAGTIAVEGSNVLLASGLGSITQAYDATLAAWAAYNTNGLLTQTAADTFTGRTLTGTADQITVTNGNGVAGNPTVSLVGLKFDIQITLPTGSDTDVTLLQYATFGFTVDSCHHKTNSGTITANVKIDGVSVTSLSALALTSAEGNATASGANTVAAGNTVLVTFSSNSTAVNASLVLHCTRT